MRILYTTCPTLLTVYLHIYLQYVLLRYLNVKCITLISDRPTSIIKPKPKYRNIGLVWADTVTETKTIILAESDTVTEILIDTETETGTEILADTVTETEILVDTETELLAEANTETKIFWSLTQMQIQCPSNVSYQIVKQFLFSSIKLEMKAASLILFCLFFLTKSKIFRLFLNYVWNLQTSSIYMKKEAMV